MKRSKTWIYFLVPLGVFLAGLLYLWLAGEADAAAVKENVVRFHVVAASDSEVDQQLKLTVRNGLFERIEELFSDCTDQAQALQKANANRSVLQAQAEAILRAQGAADSVTVEVGERFFPTKSYGALSFPAGRYQAVSVRIGAAEGENFWCVLYPALCIAPAVESEQAEGELVAVVGEQGTEFLKKSGETQRVKFFLVEWFAKIKEFFANF
ncbi:MAG: stage II sporulation protein R [Clostridia bacterium]|nr:stage II sporulation protein R [Clostridia bacterium]